MESGGGLLAAEVPWPASEQLIRRQRWYLLLRSVPLAVEMSAVAAVIAPIAAFVDSNGVRGG
jgi:hypothetical protein